MSQATMAQGGTGWNPSSGTIQEEHPDPSVFLNDVLNGRILLLVPTGDEALLLQRFLDQANLPFHACADVADLVNQFRAGAAAILLDQEILDQPGMARLVEELGGQPSWSDIPIILISSGGTEGIQSSLRMLGMWEPLGHVTVLERPLRIITLLSGLQAALHARGRQYQVRGLVDRLQDEVRHRDEFLALLAHEVRNPLGAIRNALQVLDQVGSQANLAVEQRTVIGRQTGILASLIDDVLEVFQVTSGRVALQKMPVDLTELVGRCLQGLRATTAQRHELTLQVLSSPLIVEGDPVRLGQIVGQLVLNAVKNTAPGGSVGLTLEAAGSQAILRIRDSGQGLRPDQLPHVFDLFPPPDRFPEQWRGGLSIALPIVRNLVSLHGGAVRATSAGVGQGTELVVSLPLRPQVVPLASSASPPSLSAAATRRILVIEDNPDGRETMRLLLQLWEHKVEVAVDGKDGVAKALAWKPDVALVDIGLPELDGYQVARQLRASLGNRIRLIAMTGYGQFQDYRRAKEAGFDHHFIKPVDPDELHQLLTQP